MTPSRRAALRLQAIQLLGGHCARCGITDIRVLQIDHVDGGGRQERQALGHRHGLKIAQKIIQLAHEGYVVTGYQVLCANCNLIKAYENQEWKGKSK